MGAFFALKNTPSREYEDRCRSVKREMIRQGFAAPHVFHTPGLDIYVYRKQISSYSNYVEFSNGDFIACVGTFIYRDCKGPEALRFAYQDFGIDDFADRLLQAFGNYCLIIHKFGCTSLWLDPLGIYKVFKNESESMWSSSFLALLAFSKHPKVRPQCVYEYVFQGATYGNETVVQDIYLLDPSDDPRIEPKPRSTTSPISRSLVWSDNAVKSDPETHLDNLRATYDSITTCFGDRVDTALSGGYDSRLTLALLLERNIKPRLHVYGSPTDSDVQVAKRIDSAMKLGLSHVDKSLILCPDVDEFSDVVTENFFRFDGYPIDGVFTSRADLDSRMSRVSDDYLALNGGGGEIFRNFYFLPDKPLTVNEFLWVFYSQFDPGTCTPRFSQTVYYEQLGSKILNVLGTKSQTLTRTQIERIYPLFRCRFWMGRNNSINNRFGAVLTPFIEFPTVRDAAAIPMAYKNYGRIEGEMIRLIDERLAGFPSSYGHDFRVEPPLINRLRERLNYYRPPILRRYAYRTKHRFKTCPRPSLLTNEYTGNLIGQDFPYLREYFQVNRIQDWEQMNRICTLELLFQKYNVIR